MVASSRKRLLKLVPLPVRSELAQAFDGFLVDREATRCTPKTLAFYRYALGDFLAFLRSSGKVAVSSFSAGDIRAFLVDLGGRGLKDTSVHVHARAVKTFCRWLVAEGLRSDDPMARVSMPRLERRMLACKLFASTKARYGPVVIQKPGGMGNPA